MLTFQVVAKDQPLFTILYLQNKKNLSNEGQREKQEHKFSFDFKTNQILQPFPEKKTTVFNVKMQMSLRI